MAIPINSLTDLEDYVQEIMDRANRHAPNVNKVVPALVGAVLWRKDATQVEIRERNGQRRNAAWVWINGVRYFFTYRRRQAEIQMRENSMMGPVIATFTNATSPARVHRVFSKL